MIRRLGIVPFFAMALFFGPPSVRADGPPELLAARSAYQAQVKSVSAPLVTQYKQSLETLKRTLGSRGNLQGALAVQKEIDLLDSGKISEGDNAKADDPTELKSTRTTFRRGIDAALNPLKARYAQSLQNLKKTLGGKGDIQGALAVEQELAPLSPESVPLGVREDSKLVIWNQNNEGNGDRGTKTANVLLLSNGNVIWKRINAHIPWDKEKIEKTEFPIPSTGYDSIRIEINSLINDKSSGGLGEVELWRSGKNILLGAHVNVSSIWSKNNRYQGSTLTDGDPKTFWLCKDKEKGWAEITLPPNK